MAAATTLIMPLVISVSPRTRRNGSRLSALIMTG
jgi:hypothetical protein